LSFETDTAAASEAVHESLREEIDALATRYALSDGSAKALHGLVQLVDWGEPNFVPKSGSADGSRERRRPVETAKRVALNTLVESLSGLELEPLRTARRVADVGSGGGFPGLVLAIALPQARMALIERIPDKCRFLRRAAEELGLENVEVVEGNVQAWSEGLGACDVVTSRKAGRFNTVVEWCAPLLAPGGALALWPGTSDFGEDAIAAGAEAAEAAGLRLAQVLQLPSVNRKGERIAKRLYLYATVDEN
jgi:16S rRNA (guanine(527)-N(7))-methyltransferase RsmG